MSVALIRGRISLERGGDVTLSVCNAVVTVTVSISGYFGLCLLRALSNAVVNVAVCSLGRGYAFFAQYALFASQFGTVRPRTLC